MVESGQASNAVATVDVDHGEQVPQEASGSVALICLGLAAVLLAIAPFVTRAQPADKAWFLAPINGPIVALTMMGIPAAFLSRRWLAGYRATQNRRLYLLRSRWAFNDLIGAAEYCVYFCAYLWAISLAGFAASTLIFGQWCLYRSGLRGRTWVMANLLFTAILVILLRGILGLWFPMAPIYKLLPGNIGNALGAIL